MSLFNLERTSFSELNKSYLRQHAGGFYCLTATLDVLTLCPVHMKLLPGVAGGEIEDFVRTVVLSIRAWGGCHKKWT